MDNRQKLGAILLFGGILLYGAIHIATIIHIPTVAVWSDTWGRYFKAVSETHGWIGSGDPFICRWSDNAVNCFVTEFSKSKMMQEIRERDQKYDDKYINEKNCIPDCVIARCRNLGFFRSG